MRKLRSLLYLVGQLSRREIAARYRGTTLGWLWTVLTPLLTLAVYTWVFSEVFKARWVGDAANDKTAFALNVFAGMLFLQFFAESLGRAPGLLQANANYVKKVIFPLPALPLVTIATAGFNWLIGVLVWSVLYTVVHHSPPLGLLWLPLVMLPLALMTLGLCWLVSAFGVYLRDLAPVVAFILTLLSFLSPIFYPVEILPDWIARLLIINPLTLPIEFSRSWLLGAAQPAGELLLAYWLVAGLVALLGLSAFRLLRKGFADVL